MAAKRSDVVKTADIAVEEVKAEDGYVKVISPSGHRSTVPDSIADALLESGYKRSK